MFEQRKAALLPRRIFLARLAKHIGIGFLTIAISLGVGMLGYHHFESLTWIDAFANAAMILSGMGPLGTLQTTAGKLFAGFYALYSGLALITIAGVILAPVVHRLMHKFHVDAGSEKKS